MGKKNIIRETSFAFAIDIIKLYKKLISEKEYVVSKQLLKSGTSIGANIEEAGAAQSKRDFLHKMSIASKEARETKYWLRILDESALTNQHISSYLQQIDQIVRILTSIVKTTKQSIGNS